ncbi:MAG: hypothetical protein KKI02_05640 [Planctomycetes bacterium]|nr:hypothetical protein [Planctomycetota bacterium]
MALPSLTHLQFLVLSIMGGTEKSGHEIRALLARKGAPKTGPAFYQMMSRLEDSSMVHGWYDLTVVDGQTVKERRYKVTGAGIEARQGTRDFYRRQAGPASQGGVAHA